jgi:hypothetical protein
MVLKAMKNKAVQDVIAINEGLDKAAVVLYNKSQELVPVDTGRLKASGQIANNGKKGFGAETLVEYGGPEAPYAFIVHERLDVHHEPPTQAKYLTAAVNRTRGTMTNILKRDIAAKLQGVKG